jgi:hypothetical protein
MSAEKHRKDRKEREERKGNNIEFVDPLRHPTRRHT